MSSRTIDFPHCPRNATLAACLAAALGLTAASAHSNDLSTAHTSNDSGPNPVKPVFNLPAYLGTSGGRHAGTSRPTNTPDALPHYVTSCDDDIATPGTLRYEVANAPNGATIDLSTLVCSTITLSHNAIAVNQDSLYLQGPATGTLTIDAGNQSSVFYHFGGGTFGISNTTIANGYYYGSYGSVPSGGCIYSKGNVQLTSAIVSHCKVVSSSNSAPARGAGVFTEGNLTLVGSTISDSEALAQNGADEFGGGAYVKGDFTAKYSNISNNTAFALGGGRGDGGGVYTLGDVDIEGSTISGNRADIVGGLDLDGGATHAATIVNSTISSNAAAAAQGGIWTNVPLTLASTTVAFNRCLQSCVNGGFSGGLFSNAVPLILQSSIIAGNASPDGQSDLNGAPGAVVSGANNLITSSTLPLPPLTITACPQLGPLADNGGTTLTHALGHASPAIDQGDAGNLLVDQRGAPRTAPAGGQTDIGSVEWQPGEKDERVFVGGFDGLCDQ